MNTLESIQDFKGTYPKQLWSLFFTEMWERFCFYGNRGMLMIFMTDILLFKEGDANLKYGAIQAFVYAFTFIGGLFADKILGFQKSLLWGGALMILGSTILGIDAANYFFYGICLIIVGTGFFKPNISTMVGELYKPGDVRRDAGFSLFYAGINIGALLGGGLCVYVGKSYSWNLAFLLSGIFMAIGLLNFLLTRKNLGPIGLEPKAANPDTIKRNQNLVYAGTLLALPVVYIMINNTAYTDIFMYIIGPLTLIYLLFEMKKLDSAQIKQLFAALVFIFLSIVFWAFFEQSGGSLSLVARDLLSKDLGPIQIDPNVVNNSANSLFVILLSTAIGFLWIWLKKRNIEPNYYQKFGFAFLFLGLAFYIFYSLRFYLNSEGMASLWMFTLAYLVISIGELFLSPIGLSLMTKLSPKHLWGIMMGMWFLASAYGQYFAGILGAGMASPDEKASLATRLDGYTQGYHQLAIYAFITGAIVILASRWLKGLMQTDEEA
ncbi:MAG: peptide MFS transporter [Crocinitomicaceae bacterium]|nr:peptide MFS transporter [Crocinitomicaceae bacterium]